MNEQTVNSKTIAALHRNENVATALAEKLNERMTGANFVTISKLSERPLGKSIGSLGFPQHIGTDEPLTLHSMNTNYADTPEERKAQWDKINDPTTPVDELKAIFSTHKSFKVIPLDCAGAAQLDYAKELVNFCKAGDTKEDGSEPTEVEVLKARLKAVTAQRDIAESVSALS